MLLTNNISIKLSNLFNMHDARLFIIKIYIVALCLITGTVVVSAFTYKKGDAFKAGTWKTVIQRKDGQQIVFNFEVKDTIGKKVIYILNAKERLRVDSVQLSGDSVFIQLPFFESSFRAKIAENSLQGNWVRHRGTKD